MRFKFNLFINIIATRVVVLSLSHTSLSLFHMHLAVSQQQIISARHGTQTTRGVTARLQIKPNFNRTTGLACGGGGAGGGGGGQ